MKRLVKLLAVTLVSLGVSVCLLNCSGRSAEAPTPAGTPPNATSAILLAPIRSASGAPLGIRITWHSMDGAGLSGYHLYKSSTPISDSSRGDTGLWLPVVPDTTDGVFLANSAGNQLIPQPVQPGVLQVDDLFPVVIGDQYYYRLTAVDGDGDESRLSPERLVTITIFQVTGLSGNSARIGEQLVISGERFGVYDPTTDFVYFPGVVWDDATGFSSSERQAAIESWTPSQITVEVPEGSTTGQIAVEIAGVRLLTTEVFSNLDPYITQITPAHGTIQSALTIRGANFGGQPDADTHVLLAGIAITDASYYSQYSSQEIVLTPPFPGSFGRLPVKIADGQAASNQGYYTLENIAPSPVIAASASWQLAPAEVSFDASASTDPESPLAELTFDFDWEGDGVFDALDAGPTPSPHRYTIPAGYNPTVRVTDPQGMPATQSRALLIYSKTQLSDNGSPGAGRYYQSNDSLNIRFSVGGGLPAYSVEWILRDASGLLPDLRIGSDSIMAAGDYTHAFTIDSSSRTPTQDSNTLPLGMWQLVAKLTDFLALNDPDSQFVWPSASTHYAIYRYPAVVVQDDQGDPGGTAAASIHDMLNSSGYYLSTNPILSGNADLAELAAQTVVVWAADGPHGTVEPFEWLSSVDTALMRSYLDLGGHLVILGPAAVTSATVFPNDTSFNLDYQPFTEVLPMIASPPVPLFPRDFTRTYRTLISSLDYGGAYGSSVANGLRTGALRQMDNASAPTPLTAAVAAIRPSPADGGGNLYFGQFTFANIVGYNPSGVTAAELLDNIVAGTITY